MKKIIWIVGVVIVFIAISYLFIHEKPTEVMLLTVERGEVESTVANTRAGTVESCERSKLALLIGGRIEELFVEEGDLVEKDQVLIRLWNADKKALFEQANATLTAAKLRKESICITADFDQREANRLSELARKKLVAADVVDTAKTKARASRVACNAADAEIKVANATLVLQQAILEQTILRAPFRGIVAEVHGKIGEYLTPSPPGVATPPAIDLIDMTCLYVTAPIDEIDTSEIKVGMPVRITMDAFRDVIFEGKVKKISPYVLDLEKQARTVDVDVDFNKIPDNINLLAGYSADIEIILETKKDAVRVPTEALLENNQVYVLNTETQRLQMRQLKTGLSNWHYTEIISGLSSGEKIVTSLEVEGLADGLLVEEKHD